MKGHLEVIEVLVSYGADVNSDNSVGLVPLVVAVVQGNSLVVNWLLKKGANVNSRSPSGIPAICLAAENGSSRIFGNLLFKGADIYLNLEGGKTAFGKILAGTDTSLIRMLLVHGVKKDDALIVATKLNDLNMVETLLATEVDININAKDDDGRTALMIAAREGYTKILKILLQEGADVFEQDKSGFTALTHAASARYSKKNSKVLELIKQYMEMRTIRK